MKFSATFLSCLILVLIVDHVKGAGGSCWAAPMVYGPTCQSNTAVFPWAGTTSSFRINYSVRVTGNGGTLVCCLARGYNQRTNKEQWTSIGCGHSSLGGSVVWGNSLSLPAIKCQGTPFGAMVSWSH